MSALVVAVDDPKSEGFGPTKHTTYRINCQVAGGGAVATCRHRFSDFLKLRTEMMDMMPGVVVPPLPEKKMGASGMGLGIGSAAGRDATELLEKRRSMLELFLQRVSEHPIASRCEKVAHFLSWPDAVRQAVAGTHQSFELPPLPFNNSGDSLQDTSKLLHDFEKQLHATRGTLKKIQTRMLDDALDLHEASQGIKEMGENPMNTMLSPAFSGVAEGMQSLANTTKLQAESTKAGLLARLQLYKMLAIAMQEQFKRRQAVQASIDSMNGKVKDLLGQSTKFAGKPGKEKKVAELEGQTEELKRKIEDARSLYATYTQTLHWELEQYNRTKNVELIRCLQDFSVAHLDFTSRQHEIWGHISTGITAHVTHVVANGGGAGESPNSGRRSSFGDIGAQDGGMRDRLPSQPSTPGGGTPGGGSPDLRAASSNVYPDPTESAAAAGGSLSAMLGASS